MKTITLAGTILLAVCAGAYGDMLFTFASGDRAASVNFHVESPNTLVATLTNTSTADVLNPSGVLTGVFFDTTPALTLTKVSAVLGAGSSVLFGGSDPGGVVGGEWAFADGLSGAPGGALLGIGSAGFGLFGPGDLFPGTNLQGPDSPDGLQYGITSAGDDPTTGNQKVTGADALIKNSVVFTLTFDAAGDSLLNGDGLTLLVENVSFQYGTSLDGGGAVPAPGAALLALLGLGIVRYVKRAFA
jgi:hypothetical protein